MSLVNILQSRGGAARREELLARGASRRQISQALALGAIERPHRGVYVLPATPIERVHEVIFRARSTCVTMCRAAGLPVMAADDLTHLLVPLDRGLDRDTARPTDAVRLHRSDAHSGRVASAVDIASACLGRASQLVLVDAALNRGLLSASEVEDFCSTPAERRRWLIERMDGRSQSPLETLTRLDAIDAGLRVESQVKIEGVGQVDLLVENCIVIELDGFAFHADRDQFRLDRSRDRVLAARGFAVLRYTYPDVIESRAELMRDIETMLWRLGRLDRTLANNLNAWHRRVGRPAA